MNYRVLLLLSISLLALTACGTATNNISKTNAVPNDTNISGTEMGEEISYEWKELGYMDNYPGFREVFDKIVNNIKYEDGTKSGICYVSMDMQWTNNSTLRYVFNIPQFYERIWENESVLETLNTAVKEVYADIEIDTEARLATINAYYNLFTTPEGYFNGSDTLTRAEFMAGVYKAHNPVTTLEANVELKSDDNNPFVNQMLNHSYLDLKSETNYTGTITRAEAIYTLVSMYYADELETVNVELAESYTDASNGGDIELSQAIQNPDKGMPTDLYKAILVAGRHGIITGTESRWDDILTKTEALELITNVYSETDLTKEVAFNNTTTNEQQEQTGQQEQTDNQQSEDDYYANRKIMKRDDGKIIYWEELESAVKSALREKGLSTDYCGNIVENYYYATRDKNDDTKIYNSVINSLVKDLKEQVDAYNNQQNQNNNSNNGYENNVDGSNGGESLPPSNDGYQGDESDGIDENQSLGDRDRLEEMLNAELDEDQGGTFGGQP